MVTPATKETTSTRQRRERLSREELRELLLATGEEILRNEGMAAGVGSLTFKRAFEWIEEHRDLRFTNASVIGRIWSGLEEYRADVLALVSDDFASGEIDAVAESQAPYFEAVDLTDPASRLATIRQLCRAGAAAALLPLDDGDAWVPWLGVLLAHCFDGQQPGMDRLGEAIRRSVSISNSSWEVVYTEVCQAVGWRFRPPLTASQFVRLVGALADGFVMANSVVEPGPMITLATGEDGANEEWHNFAVAFEALTFAFFEPDPDWTPPV